MKKKNAQNGVTEPEIQQEITVLASFLPVIAGVVAVRKHVSRQPSNSRGRKGTAQGPRGVQASDRREVRHAILHHQLGRKGCSSLSLRGVAADRRKVGAALELQPNQKKVLEPHQLLRPSGGDGRAGKTASAIAAARVGGDQRRSCGGRQPDVPGSAEHRELPEGYPREPVHGSA